MKIIIILLNNAIFNQKAFLIKKISIGSRGSMDRAFDYGSKGWGFESLRDRTSFFFLLMNLLMLMKIYEVQFFLLLV